MIIKTEEGLYVTPAGACSTHDRKAVSFNSVDAASKFLIRMFEAGCLSPFAKYEVL